MIKYIWLVALYNYCRVRKLQSVTWPIPRNESGYSHTVVNWLIILLNWSAKNRHDASLGGTFIDVSVCCQFEIAKNRPFWLVETQWRDVKNLFPMRTLTVGHVQR